MPKGNKKRWSRGKRGWALIIVGAIVGIVLLIPTSKAYRRMKYTDRRIKRLACEAADRHGLEPALVLGVIRRESNFDPDVRGADGEYGLMQVTRIAARDWERVNRRTIRFDRDLFDPELNVEVGTWYLAQGWKRFTRSSNQTTLALSYYNAGPGRAREWSEKYKENLLERIPFSSTREYILRVCEYRDEYRKEAAHENRLAKD
jgi:soluble lytic murein transglycosylase